MDTNKRPGDSDAITRHYMDSLLIEFRQLDCCVPNTGFNLFGKSFRTPIMTAALSHLDNLHADGIPELVHGAAMSGAIACVGYISSEELHKSVKQGAELIKFVKPYADRGRVYAEMEEAKELGCFALGMDIDHGFSRLGKDDMDGLMHGVSSAELAAFIKKAGLPFIVKGVLSVVDAQKCRDAGADGIVISHHHGIMDFALPPLKILPVIRQALGADMLIITDCGINSGADVFKSLALGADAVMVGRSLIGDDFRKRGAEAVKDTIEHMTAELAGFMAHTAAADLHHITADIIWE
jgi:isopentenyl diphosphate isomerase/L-lactate dehydrogenase-like FMN-dependent dehydrogenase